MGPPPALAHVLALPWCTLRIVQICRQILGSPPPQVTFFICLRLGKWSTCKNSGLVLIYVKEHYLCSRSFPTEICLFTELHADEYTAVNISRCSGECVNYFVICLSIYLYVYICMYMYMYVYTYIFIHIRAHHVRVCT